MIKEDIVLKQLIEEIKNSTRQYIGEYNNKSIQDEIHKETVDYVITNILEYTNIELKIQ